MISNIFDCHLHVDKGLDNYNIPMENGNIIFNNVDHYKQESDNYLNYYKSLIFDYKNNFDFIIEEASKQKIVAYKIHSRIQKITNEDYSILLEMLKKLPNNIPLIYDAFYFGSDLKCQPSLEGLIYLATNLPHKKFIVAHAGGYKIIEFFLHLKELKNIAYDLSLSLQYLSDSSCQFDLVKLIKYTQSERIFFGTDFPIGDPMLQYDQLIQILSNLNMNSKKIEEIFTTNWLNFSFNTL